MENDAKRGTINYRKQFWIDLANSDWARKSQERMDEIIFKLLTGEKEDGE